MKKSKFLTVYAVLDDVTQMHLTAMQSNIISNVSPGTQTMGIPFHITLGSFSTDDENDVVDIMERISKHFSAFDISLNSIDNFDDRVLFLSPGINDRLTELHSHFDSNYADGYEWHQHCTIFCAEPEEIALAKEILKVSFEPMLARIVAIEVGEFFPARIIKRYYLNEKAE